MFRLKKFSYKGSTYEFRVGLFILTPVLIIAVFVALKLGYSLAVSTMDVYLKVDKMTSINKGTPVKIKGYELGQVVDVKPMYKPALHFIATMRIRRDVELYEDCSALIMNQNVIGDPVVEIRNPEKQGEFLREGDVVEGIESSSLEEVLKKANILLSELTATVSVYKEVSIESKQNLRNLITSLAGSIANINLILQSSQKDVIEIFSNMRKTAKTMDEIAVELKKNPVKFLFRGKKE